MAVDTRPLSPSIGVEVVDVDLRDEPSPALVDDLRRWYGDHHLLLFRAQELSEARQQDVVGWFGPLDDRLSPTPGYRLTSERADGRGELRFHSDFCFLDPLLRGLTLYAERVPETGGNTEFVSAVRGCETLPPAWRDELAGLQAVHVYDPRRRLGADYAGSDDVPDGGYRAVHPLICPHPVTGVPVLYANPWMTEAVVGLEPAQAAEVLDAVCAHLLGDDAARYEHVWREGDFVLWDNISLLHRRKHYDPTQARRMFRLQVGLPA